MERIQHATQDAPISRRVCEYSVSSVANTNLVGERKVQGIYAWKIARQAEKVTLILEGLRSGASLGSRLGDADVDLLIGTDDSQFHTTSFPGC